MFNKLTFQSRYQIRLSAISLVILQFNQYSVLRELVMSDCCHSGCAASPPPKKHSCPINGQEYKTVTLKTILHHINSAWKWTGKEQGYYFCDDPNCGVVYFGEDNSLITKSELRTIVGIKDSKPDALACYCFGVSNSDAQLHPNIRNFIVQKTKAGICSCDTSNPSGHCCLKDFPSKDNRGH
jgi:hypothetical protein